MRTSTPDTMAANDDAPPPRFSRTAIVGAIWAALGVTAFLLAFAPHRSVAVPAGSTESYGPQWWQIALRIFVGIPGILAPIGTTACGIVAISQIRHSRGRLYDLSLAVFDALLFPLIAVNVLVYWLICRREYPTPDTAITNTIIVCALLDIVIITFAWCAAATTDKSRSITDWPTNGALSIAPAGMASMSLLPVFGAKVIALTLVLLLGALVCGITAWKTRRGKLGVGLASVAVLVIVVIVRQMSQA